MAGYMCYLADDPFRSYITHTMNSKVATTPGAATESIHKNIQPDTLHDPGLVSELTEKIGGRARDEQPAAGPSVYQRRRCLFDQ